MKLPKLFPLKPKKKLQATARRAAAPVMDDYDDEPQTKLSSAFVVVLILHVVAVGGIYAFNSIKAHRVAREAAFSTVAQSAPAPVLVPSVESEAPLARSSSAPSTAEVSPATAPLTLASGGKVHPVKPGENLTRIAAHHAVAVADLAEANGLKTTAVLRPGQTLNIPPSRKGEVAKKGEAASKKVESAAPKLTATEGKAPTKSYVVAKGDTPVAIARKLNVSYAELLKLNNITDPTKLRIGQPLKVPAKKTN
jgi:LysM repeat protein